MNAIILLLICFALGLSLPFFFTFSNASGIEVTSITSCKFSFLGHGSGFIFFEHVLAMTRFEMADGVEALCLVSSSLYL